MGGVWFQFMGGGGETKDDPVATPIYKLGGGADKLLFIPDKLLLCPVDADMYQLIVYKK